MFVTVARHSNPLWGAVFGVLLTSVSWGDVRLPGLVSDNMVLQRDAKINLWGWAEPGELVRIAFHGVQVKAKADKNGRWTVPVGPFDAGGPYEMTVKGKNSLLIHNVLLGDVWLASGQSNMEFPLRKDGNFGGVENADREIAEADFPKIRLFKVHHKVALKPQKDVEADTWMAAMPETVGSFSAVAYLFGRELHQRYHVPIGLIESNWGGTAAEAWVSEASLKSFQDFRESIESLKRIDEKSAAAEYDQYVKQKTAWDEQHATEDRGRVDGRNFWAEVNFNDAVWPTIVEPQTKPHEELKGFDGTVWYRKSVDLPKEYEGKELHLNLGPAVQHDTTYFNGERIGETQGWGDPPREYVVPARLVKAGRNVIAVRMTGGEGYVGLFGEADKMNLEIGKTTIPLAGMWSYQTGTDLSALPKPTALAKLNVLPITSTLLFNGMIAPLTPYRIRGVIWYQGESNADRPSQYRTLFPALIQDWRSHWGYQVPFLFVQLAGFRPNKPEPAEYPWAELREAQSMTLSLPHTGMATAVDVGDEADVHPKDKQAVAHRLALAAAHVTYGEHLIFSGPAYQSMKIDGPTIRLKFSSVGSGLLIKDKYGYGRGFEIAGTDGKFVWAQARIDGNDVLVSSESIQQPVAVRYDWSNTPDGNLFNKEGLPALPFRTDAPAQ
jgi:sialate O-acetylesterase